MKRYAILIILFFAIPISTLLLFSCASAKNIGETDTIIITDGKDSIAADKEGEVVSEEIGEKAYGLALDTENSEDIFKKRYNCSLEDYKWLIS